MQLAAGSIQKSILWKRNNQSSHKKLILFVSFINIWWLSHQSLASKFLPVLDFCCRKMWPLSSGVKYRQQVKCWLQFNHIPMKKQHQSTDTMCLCSLSHSGTQGRAMWQSFAAQWQICEGGMNYLWRALALFAGFINSSGGCSSKAPTNTVEKHVLWHLSTRLIGNLGLQDCRMHLHSQVASIIHRKCKNYRTRSSRPSEMVKKNRITAAHWYQA